MMKKFKTLKTVLAVALAIFATNAALASGKVKVEMNSKNSESAVVEISNSKMSNIEINVKDSYGEVLYSNKMQRSPESFKTKFDFSGLKDGMYRFIVKIDQEKTENKFKVEDGEVNVIEVRKSLDPYFLQQGKKLEITYLNYQKEPVTMYVYDRSNTLLYEKELGNDFVMNHGVDLSKLRFGDYEVVLANQEDLYEYNVSVR